MRKRGKPVAVRVVRRTGETALVEWLEGEMPKRGYLPVTEISAEGEVARETLVEAVPYGVEWGKYIEPHVTSQGLARALRQHGIWTLEDLREKWAEAKTALWEASMYDLVGMLKRVEEASK